MDHEICINSQFMAKGNDNQTPQNSPSTLWPCITTPQPAIKLTSHSTAKTRIGRRSSSVLCKNGRALYPRNVI